MQAQKEVINGVELLTRSWTIENSIANILIVHGYGEHSARYEETASRLNTEGYSVYTYDRRGEGASEGKKAHIQDMDNHVTDLVEIRSNLPRDGNDLFILAHSLGGLITVKYLIDKKPTDIKGVMLSSALLKADENMAPMLQKVAGIAALIAPWLPSVKLDSTLVSRDKNEVAKYDNDPLIFHGTTNAKTGYEILKTIKYVQSKFSEIEYPFLAMHGTADQISSPKGSQLLYDAASSSDKSIEFFEGLYHETMREPEKELFFTTILKWLKQRV